MNPSANPQPRITDEQLEHKVLELFGDAQLTDGGYHALYDGKWVDMTNEVVEIAKFVQQYAKDYASELIGEPEPLHDGEYTNQLIAAKNNATRKRNRPREHCTPQL